MGVAEVGVGVWGGSGVGSTGWSEWVVGRSGAWKWVGVEGGCGGAGGRWQVAGGRWQVAGGRWQVAGEAGGGLWNAVFVVSTDVGRAQTVITTRRPKVWMTSKHATIVTTSPGISLPLKPMSKATHVINRAPLSVRKSGKKESLDRPRKSASTLSTKAITLREIGRSRRVPNVGPAETHASRHTKIRTSPTASSGSSTRVGMRGAPALASTTSRCGGGGGIGGGDGDGNGDGGDFGGDGNGGGDGGSAGGIGGDGGCGGCAGGSGVGDPGEAFGCMGLEGGDGGDGGGDGGDGGTLAGSMGGSSCWRSTDSCRAAVFPAEHAASMTSMRSTRPSIGGHERCPGTIAHPIWQCS